MISSLRMSSKKLKGEVSLHFLQRLKEQIPRPATSTKIRFIIAGFPQLYTEHLISFIVLHLGNFPVQFVLVLQFLIQQDFFLWDLYDGY